MRGEEEAARVQKKRRPKRARKIDAWFGSAYCPGMASALASALWREDNMIRTWFTGARMLGALAAGGHAEAAPTAVS